MDSESYVCAVDNALNTVVLRGVWRSARLEKIVESGQTTSFQTNHGDRWYTPTLCFLPTAFHLPWPPSSKCV
eukprot:COSAG05_NODE_2024_length_3677_cov_2.848239_2_plen_72_part_00